MGFALRDKGVGRKWVCVRNYPKLFQRSQNRKEHRPKQDAEITEFTQLIKSTQSKARRKR